jgi:hypothetical protein
MLELPWVYGHDGASLLTVTNYHGRSVDISPEVCEARVVAEFL